MPAHKLDEELLQGMRFRNHCGSHLRQKARVASDQWPSHSIGLLNLSSSVMASDFCKSAKSIFPIQLEGRSSRKVLRQVRGWRLLAECVLGCQFRRDANYYNDLWRQS